MAEPKPQQSAQPAQPRQEAPTQQEGELAAPPEELAYSRDARHSTYSEAQRDEEAEEYPPPGQQVEQTLGKPQEASE